MKHVWSIVCRNLLEDKITNNPSLIDVTEHIGFTGDLPDERPVTLPFPVPFLVVSNWWRDDDDDRAKYPCRLRIISPDSTQLKTIEFEVNLEEVASMRTFGHVSEFPYTVNGVYQFEIAYKPTNRWKVVARIPLAITHEEPESEQQESDSTD